MLSKTQWPHDHVSRPCLPPGAQEHRCAWKCTMCSVLHSGPICLHRHPSPCGMLHVCPPISADSASLGWGLLPPHLVWEVSVIPCECIRKAVDDSTPFSTAVMLHSWFLPQQKPGVETQKFCFKSCPCILPTVRPLISYYYVSRDCSHSLTYYMGRHYSRHVTDAGTEAQKK